MLPVLALLRRCDCGSVDSVLPGHVVLAFDAVAGSDRANIVLGQYRPAMSLADLGCAVFNFVGDVLDVCRPPQMDRVYAALMPLAARVCGFVIGGWRRAVGLLTNDRGSVSHSSVQPDLSVTTRANEGPRQTMVAGVRKSFVEKAHRSANLGLIRAATEWIAVTAPALVMRATPTSRKIGLIAAVDRTLLHGGAL